MQTILLVEDNKLLRFANERVLAKAGYRVISAEDGETALRKASDDLPDLILLDMMLPRLSGPEVLQALKRNSITAIVPVVILTGLSQKNEKKLLDEGATAFLEKGVVMDKPDILIKAIGQILASQEIQKAGIVFSEMANHTLSLDLIPVQQAAMKNNPDEKNMGAR